MTMKNNSGTCGIYKITHKDTGQAYVGLSENIEKRWYEHIHSPKLKNSYIDRAIKKHGEDKFDLEIIEELPNDRSLLMEREEYWVSYYNTYENDFHYNLTPGGDFSPMKVPEIAAKMSGENNPMKNPEIAAKKSKAMSGKNNPMYGKRGKESPRFGRKHTSETKEKMSKAHKGKKLSEEAKQKMSKAKSGENNPMFGKRHSEDARKKMSKAHSGKNHHFYGKKLSEETRKKMSESHKGKKLSEEHKKNLSKAQNTTGYFRVSTHKCPKCKQGFTYVYEYDGEDKKRKQITSVNIKKLEKKVKQKGLEWFKLEE